MARPVAVVLSMSVALVLLLVPAGPGPAAGDDLSRLEGVVADSQGRPLASASVTVRGPGMQPWTVVTAADGSFRFWGLRAVAGYRIAASLPGYRSVEYDGMRLESGRRRIVRFRLKGPDERDAVVLATNDPFPYDALVTAFLDDLGVPARVIDLDAEADPAEAVRHVAAEKPNVILATGLRAGRLVRSEVRDIPSILTLIDDPRRYDLAATNICFLANNPDPEDVIERLKRLLPQARRIGLLYDADRSELLARDLEKAADRSGFVTQVQPCYTPSHVRDALTALTGRVDALVLPYDALSLAPSVVDAVVGWGLRHRVPVVATQAEWVRQGALVSYGVPPDHLGAEARAMALGLLAGSHHPEDLGLKIPRNAVLETNPATAATIGVSLPAGE
jgi:putative ABC transport system substrate-binding protein